MARIARDAWVEDARRVRWPESQSTSFLSVSTVLTSIHREQAKRQRSKDRGVPTLSRRELDSTSDLSTLQRWSARSRKPSSAGAMVARMPCKLCLSMRLSVCPATARAHRLPDPAFPPSSALLDSNAGNSVTTRLILFTLLSNHSSLPDDGLVAFLASKASPELDLETALADTVMTLDGQHEDAVALAEADAALKAKAEADRARWTTLCRVMFSTELIPRRLLDLFEFPLLERVGLVNSAAASTRRSTRVGTLILCVLQLERGPVRSADPHVPQLHVAEIQPAQRVLGRLLASLGSAPQPGGAGSRQRPRHGTGSRRSDRSHSFLLSCSQLISDLSFRSRSPPAPCDRRLAMHLGRHR